MELRKMMMFDKVWLKLSQALALIEEEIPRLQSSKEDIPFDTIRIFVCETRSDLQCLSDAMTYVENFEKWTAPKPEWFKFDKEISDEDLEDELSTLVEYEVDNLSNYDSFIERLRDDVRGTSQSFIEFEQEQIAHNYQTERTDVDDEMDEQVGPKQMRAKYRESLVGGRQNHNSLNTEVYSTV
jgi:hypothetical protein